MILAACAYFGVRASASVVIGDIGADVQAASAAGARGVLVPTPRTLASEVDRADEVARDLLEAVTRAIAPAVEVST